MKYSTTCAFYCYIYSRHWPNQCQAFIHDIIQIILETDQYDNIELSQMIDTVKMDFPEDFPYSHDTRRGFALFVGDT